jgi:hypothetical protein
MREKERWKFDAALGTVFRTVLVFKEEKRIYIVIFLFNMAG